MDVMSVNLKLNSGEFKKNIQKTINEKYYKPILTKTAVDLRRDNRIHQLIVKYLFLQPIFRAVMGAYPGSFDKDLQAHLGLSEEMKADFSAGLVKYLASVIHIRTRFTDKNATISVGFLNNKEQQELIDADFEWGEYISNSYGNQELIPFLHWLMLTESDPIFEYTINFNLTEKGQHVSRSGRALMVNADLSESFDDLIDDDEELEDVFWQLDLSVFKKENFIFALFQNQNFQNSVFKVIDKTFLSNWNVMTQSISSRRK